MRPIFPLLAICTYWWVLRRIREEQRGIRCLLSTIPIFNQAWLLDDSFYSVKTSSICPWITGHYPIISSLADKEIENPKVDEFIRVSNVFQFVGSKLMQGIFSSHHTYVIKHVWVSEQNNNSESQINSLTELSYGTLFFNRRSSSQILLLDIHILSH